MRVVKCESYTRMTLTCESHYQQVIPNYGTCHLNPIICVFLKPKYETKAYPHNLNHDRTLETTVEKVPVENFEKFPETSNNKAPKNVNQEIFY